MGQVGSEDEFLPVHFNVDTFRLLGNVIDGSYAAVLDYKDIHQKDPAQPDTIGQRVNTTCPSPILC